MLISMGMAVLSPFTVLFVIVVIIIRWIAVFACLSGRGDSVAGLREGPSEGGGDE